jgi:hypothetical protein
MSSSRFEEMKKKEESKLKHFFKSRIELTNKEPIKAFLDFFFHHLKGFLVSSSS